MTEHEAVRRRRAEPHRACRHGASRLAHPDAAPALETHAKLLDLRLEERNELAGNVSHARHLEGSSISLEESSKVS